jgi:hypothetical protein
MNTIATLQEKPQRCSFLGDGQVQRAEINASETECLVGMGLLEE